MILLKKSSVVTTSSPTLLILCRQFNELEEPDVRVGNNIAFHVPVNSQESEQTIHVSKIISGVISQNASSKYRKS